MRKTNTLIARQSYLYRLPVPSDLLYNIGDYLLSRVPQRRSLAFTMWDIAATMGNSDAIRGLCKFDLFEGESHHRAPFSARFGIERLAEQRNDFQAMTFHARNLSLANQKQLALPLVMEVCGMTEPGPVMNYGVREAGSLPLPWKSWVNALDRQAAAAPEWQLAWKYGAEIWDDPEACAKHARSTSVVPGTEEWLRSATKAAMAGESSFFQDLGKYYLALHGWFPKSPRRVSTAVDSKIGFAWLEMSTFKFEPPERAANIWAGMALVLREHGNRSKGMKYLQRGLENIQDRKHIGAADEEKAATVLTSLIQKWDVQDLVNSREEKVTSTTFLGQPIIPVQP